MTVHLEHNGEVHSVFSTRGNLEVHFSQAGDFIAVTAFASSPEHLAEVATALFDEYGADDFTQPEHCADGKWGVFGYIGRRKCRTRFG